MTTWVWIAIVVCISQSALLSGLNLALFSVSKLQLEVERAKGDRSAQRVLRLRKDSNALLVTILWANVAINVLLAQLSGSVLTGVAAFLFSSVIITVVGEIIPQAYFSRHALKMASRLSPLIRFYQVLLYPIVKPTAWVLDRWLGPEAIRYFREKDFRELLRIHAVAEGTDIDAVEGTGALNFLSIDDLLLEQEGEPIDPQSIIRLDFRGGRPVFPPIEPTSSDPFLQQIHRSGKKWVIVVDSAGEPRMAIKSDGFLRDALFGPSPINPYFHCHRPIIVHDPQTKLGEIIPRFKVRPAHSEDDVVDEDVILLWDNQKRIITGSDILGRLLRGIVQNVAHLPRVSLSDKPGTTPSPNEGGL